MDATDTNEATDEARDEPSRGRRLERSSDDRIIAGVCSGIADHFGIDVSIVRVITVVLTIFGGAGLLLYVVGWAMIPDEDAPASHADVWFRHGAWHPIAGLVLIAIAISIISGRIWGAGDFGFPLFLIGLGAFLLFVRQPEPPAIRPDLPPPPVNPPVADPELRDQLHGWQRSARHELRRAQSEWRRSQRDWRRARRAQRLRRRSLTIPTLGLLAIGGGVIGMVLANGQSVDATRVLAAGLVIVGVGLIIATWVGRAGGLIFIGLLLFAALSFSAALDIPFRGGVGERSYVPANVRELADEYELAVGELRLDVRNIRPSTGQVVRITATVGIGHLLIDVPNDVEVAINGHSELGEVRIAGRDENGWRVDHDQRLNDGNEGAGRIEIDATVGIGQVEVREGIGRGEVQGG